MNSETTAHRYSSNTGMKYRNKWLLGVLFTFVIALLGFLLALIPGFSYIGQLACAIILAVSYRQIFGYPEKLREGITFSTQKLLRLAIILYGLQLNIAVVLTDGASLLIRDAVIITFAILFTLWLAKVLKADYSISMLLGVGTGICGAAAIAAVAPILKAKNEDTAISVGIIALMGTVFSIIYILLRPIIPLESMEYGIWSGMSLHELAHVAIAAEPAGQDALAIALLAKLGRVFLLIPVCFVLIFCMKKISKEKNAPQVKIPFPYFLLGFIGMSLINTFVLNEVIPFPNEIMVGVENATTWLLTAAMVGLGLNVIFKDLRNKAFKPLIAMCITTVFVSIISFLLL
ncbi:YeiH family protein [Marinococcus halophilus]|uniref:YeiH family protein n=1 Tax=Marinococcus halophilus TaxID=1371 RepID=UPI0009A6486E